MKYFKKTRIASAVTIAATVLLSAGCGGGGSSSSDEDQADSVVSRGIVTGFGSVYVNGVRYRTGNSQFSIDDRDGDERDLRIGMIVTVHASSNDNGKSWNAATIVYDNELKGPITAIDVDPADSTRKTLTILGVPVLIDTNTTIDDDGGLTFDGIAVGDVVEVSGYTTADGLTATHIELQDNDDEIEIKGRIANLTDTGFMIRGFDISYDGNTELEDIDTLRNGLLVEVKGRLDGAGTTLIAEEIEAEDEFGDEDDDEAKIEGVIYDFNADDASFMIQDVRVDAASAELYPSSLQLADGLTVKVEGHLLDGVLIAEEIEQKGKKVEIMGPLSSISDTALTFSFDNGDIIVRYNRETEFEDDEDEGLTRISDLSPGAVVEVEAFAESEGVVNAVEVKRKDDDEIEVKAPLQGFDPVTRVTRLLGIDFDLSAAEFEDDDDNSLGADEFFDSLRVGEFIKIKDKDSNGVFDEAELED